MLDVGPVLPGGVLMSRQGLRPRRRHWHNGIDLGAPPGQNWRGREFFAVMPGEVEEVCAAGSSRCSGYGNGVLVRHDEDLFSWYAHADEILTVPGVLVGTEGPALGRMGVSFGTPEDPGRVLEVPHVHLELVRSGWPFSSRDVAARYDVLGVLARRGLGVASDGSLVQTDPFSYSEPGLSPEALVAASKGDVRDFEPVPPENRRKIWPVVVALGASVLAGAGIALSGRGRGRGLEDW